MLRYIVCEDNRDFLNRICNVIHKVMMPYNFEYKISKFVTYDYKVEKAIEVQHEQKVYILDIELNDVSGLEIASEIRETDVESIIVFVTSHNECKNDIFHSRLQVLDYISKDRFWTDRLENTIEYIVKNVHYKRVLAFNYNHSSYRIPFNEIVYIEKVQDNQKCIINTESGDQFEITTTITELTKKLGPNFFQSHKSCIVNLDKIKDINYADCIITFINEECIFLLSSRRKKQLREQFIGYVNSY